jgi:putative endonuclease
MHKTGYVYILTNERKTVLYVGVTNSIKRRLWEHVNEPKGFVKRYNVNRLVQFEAVVGMMNAINREKQIKRWSRAKKEGHVERNNPDWRFLNDEVLGEGVD